MPRRRHGARPLNGRFGEVFLSAGRFASRAEFRSRIAGNVRDRRSPSWVVVDPGGRFLYAVTEEGRIGSVSAFSIDRATGKLTALNTVSTKGNGPCHLAVDHTGKTLLAANYDSGSTVAFPIHGDGSLGEAASFIQHMGSGPDKSRQAGPHAHCTTVSPDNRFALVNDLGLDEILIYKMDPAKALLTPNDPPFGKVPPGALVQTRPHSAMMDGCHNS